MTVCVIVCAWRRTYVCTLASMCTLAVVQYLKYKKKQQLTTAAIYVVAAHVYAPGAVIKITDRRMTAVFAARHRLSLLGGVLFLQRAHACVRACFSRSGNQGTRDHLQFKKKRKTIEEQQEHQRPVRQKTDTAPRAVTPLVSGSQALLSLAPSFCLFCWDFCLFLPNSHKG